MDRQSTSAQEIGHKLSADEVRKDPEGLAPQEVLFSSEEIEDRQIARPAPEEN